MHNVVWVYHAYGIFMVFQLFFSLLLLHNIFLEREPAEQQNKKKIKKKCEMFSHFVFQIYDFN